MIQEKEKSKPNSSNGWKISRFSDIADYSIGKTPPRKNGDYWNPDKGVSWVSIADMEPFVELTRTEETVSEKAIKEIFKKPPVPRGTLLMSFKLTIGRTAVLGIDAYHNEAIISIYPKPGMDRDFLKYFLPTIQFSDHQDRAVKGQTLNSGKIDNLPISYPKLEEQKTIAGTLGTLQKAVATQKEIVAKLKELKAATMAKLFREGLKGEKLKQTEIGEIPESWDVVRLGDCCKTLCGGTPSRDNPDFWTGNIPWVKTGEINYRTINDTAEKITEKGLNCSAAKVFPKGTLLIALYGQGVTRGRVAMLGIDATTNQACAGIFPDSRLIPEFLYGFLEFSYTKLRTLGHGANQTNLNAEIVKGFKIVLPSDINEQNQFAEVFKTFSAEIEIAEKRLEQTDRLFASSLHALLGGALRPG